MRVDRAPAAAPVGPARAGLNLEGALEKVSERRGEEGEQKGPFLGGLGRTWGGWRRTSR